MSTVRKLRYVSLFVLLVIGVGLGWFYGTETGTRIRLLIADSLITTRHANWAAVLIGKQGVRDRELRYERQFDRMGAVSTSSVNLVTQHAALINPNQLYKVEEIKGKHYKGFLLYVYDPLKLKIGVPGRVGEGETVSSMVKRLQAVAGVNGGGFLDPEFMGNGSIPMYLVMSGGELLFNSKKETDTPVHIVGIDKNGILIAGKYAPSELIKLGVREAVSFAPKFIEDGIGLIDISSDGWGIAPRTAIGQLSDGTIVFAVIDGRQIHSIGASLFDLQQLFLELGAITAANLDGGASTELVVGNQIMNKPATRLGERPIPTAWLLFENPDTVNIGNPWLGLTSEDWQDKK